MMYRKSYFKCFGTLLLISLLAACNGEQKIENDDAEAEADSDKNIELVRNEGEKRVDVLINGELFTSYIYPETIKKPVLYPIITAEGTNITRGFPMEPREGERVDHPHHVGLWFNYGDVNGLDFWNNSDAIPEEKKSGFGTIIHKEINDISSGDDEGRLEVTMEWIGPEGEVLLEENTTFVFRGTDDKRSIDRITKLTALDEDISMKDNKEGVLGLRMARELELPSDQPGIFTDASGKATEVPALNNEGVTGMYRSSEGIEGDEVWGTRGKWMNLSGQINDENISVAILDHPDNVGYPTYWHARGYGLYAANPLGQKEMSGGKEELNFNLPAGESVTFKHRIIIYSGEELADEQVNNDWDEFSN
ncbi:MAG: PmoA family protein [Anditalea sp.]